MQPGLRATVPLVILSCVSSSPFGSLSKLKLDVYQLQIMNSGVIASGMFSEVRDKKREIPAKIRTSSSVPL